MLSYFVIWIFILWSDARLVVGEMVKASMAAAAHSAARDSLRITFMAIYGCLRSIFISCTSTNGGGGIQAVTSVLMLFDRYQIRILSASFWKFHAEGKLEGRECQVKSNANSSIL